MVGSTLRLGLIGCGRAAERLWIPAFRAVEEARLVVAVDPRAERRALIAGQVQGCRQVAAAEDLMTAGTVDALIIATPAESHFELARRGLEAGIPLLVEKPLAATLAQTQELHELRCALGTSLMVGFNRRWWSPAIELRGLRQRNPDPARVELVFVTQAATWNAITGTPDLLDDLSTHQLDLLRFVLGEEIESVCAHKASMGEIRMDVQLTHGSSATCRVAHAGFPEESVRVWCGSQRAWIHAKSNRTAPADGTLRTALDWGERVWRRINGGRSSLLRSFEEELRAFVGVVRNGGQASPGTGDALAAARAVGAARQSLASDSQWVIP